MNLLWQQIGVQGNANTLLQVKLYKLEDQLIKLDLNFSTTS